MKIFDKRHQVSSYWFISINQLKDIITQTVTKVFNNGSYALLACARPYI